MRKRFQQNMQDISFTIMTYMPLLSKHMLDEMDVEALIAELQSLSRASKMQQSAQVAEKGQTVSPKPQHSPPATSTLSLESSVEFVPSSDSQSETSSASFLSVSPQPEVLQPMEPTVETLEPPGHPPQVAEVSSLGRQTTSSAPSAPSAPLLEPKAQSESGVSSSAVSSNDDFVLVSAQLFNPKSAFLMYSSS
jgi:peroxin-3